MLLEWYRNVRTPLYISQGDKVKAGIIAMMNKSEKKVQQL
jgi:hypothetical protein